MKLTDGRQVTPVSGTFDRFEHWCAGGEISGGHLEPLPERHRGNGWTLHNPGGIVLYCVCGYDTTPARPDDQAWAAMTTHVDSQAKIATLRRNAFEQSGASESAPNNHPDTATRKRGNAPGAPTARTSLTDTHDTHATDIGVRP